MKISGEIAINRKKRLGGNEDLWGNCYKKKKKVRGNEKK